MALSDLRYYRKKQRLTLKELAEKSQVSIMYLSELERKKKKNPSGKVLYKISQALNIRITDLIDE